MGEVFISDIEDCVIRGNWHELSNGKRISFLPLYDRKNELYARLSLGEARQWCSKNGCRVPTVDELKELHSASVWIRPVTLPTAAMVTAAGLPLTTAAINKFRNENMASKAWATIHDNTVDKELEAVGYDGEEPVANIGKCWAELGDASNKGALFGWRNEDGTYIQNPYSGHGLHHHDYASTTYVVSLESGGSKYDSYSDAVLAAAESDIGVKEDLGRNDGKRIREYLKPFGLRPPQNWCAVAVAAWLREAAESGFGLPIKGSPGAQATMVQLKKAGLWVDRRKLNKDNILPGNVIVWRRPSSESWTGHIGIIKGYDESSGNITTIEGNSGPMADRVAINYKRSVRDPLLLGVGKWHGDEPKVIPITEPPDREPLHSDSDVLEYDADHLFSRWLGTDKLVYEQPILEDDKESETGLDISSWQRPSSLNWDIIEQLHSFVICRATYGTKKDKHFVAHSKSIARTHLSFGAYHFIRTSQPWAKQLDEFCKCLDDVGYGELDLLPVLDIERNDYDPWQPTKLLSYSHHMAEVLASRYGDVMLYVSPSIDAVLGKPDLFRKHPIWVAHYGVDEPSFDGDWAIWQKSGSYRGPEADGPLDLNVAKVLPHCV